jgi:hypothetical protein
MNCKKLLVLVLVAALLVASSDAWLYRGRRGRRGRFRGLGGLAAGIGIGILGSSLLGGRPYYGYGPGFGYGYGYPHYGYYGRGFGHGFGLGHGYGFGGHLPYY